MPKFTRKSFVIITASLLKEYIDNLKSFEYETSVEQFNLVYEKNLDIIKTVLETVIKTRNLSASYKIELGLEEDKIIYFVQFKESNKEIIKFALELKKNK